MSNSFKKLLQHLAALYTKFQDQRLIDSLLKDVDVDVEYAKTLLQNQVAYLNTCQYSPYNNRMSRAQKQMYMRLAKRVIGEVSSLRNIVGIQPMTGPVGLIYALQYTFKDEMGEPIPKPTGNIPHRMALEVRSLPVAAKTRKLQAAWNVEIAHDQMQQHGVDIEEEFISILASEVSNEIFNETLHNLVTLSNASGVEQAVFPAPTIKNELMTLLIMINQQAHSIAARTRRGAGNILVTTPMVVSLFQMMNKHGISFKSPDKVSVSIDGLTHAGDIVIGPEESVLYKVFMSTSQALRKEHKDLVLVLYKGGSGECDTGYVYAPFVPLLPIGIVIDPDTLQPTCRMMTRYGLWQEDSPAAVPSSAYYRTIEVDALGFLSQDPTSETVA
jgi:hypothetical protein